jgi:uncharacterized membrane protein YdjX (TVP38/TMEM64 family)
MNPWGWVVLLVLVAAGLIHLIAQIPIEAIDFVVLEEGFRELGIWAYVLFVLAFALLALLPIPSTFWVLLGGGLFGPAAGTVLSVIGATISATLAFLLARRLAREPLRRWAGPRVCRVLRGVEAEGWRFVAMTRLIPVFPFAPTNYALGVTGIGLRSYMLTTSIALIPNLAAYTWLGYATRQAMTGAENVIELFLIVLALFALLLFLPGFIRRLRHAPPQC